MTGGERDGPGMGVERDGPADREAAEPDTPSGSGVPDEAEELVAAPAWATLLLVLTPFVIGLLVIAAFRWLL